MRLCWRRRAPSTEPPAQSSERRGTTGVWSCTWDARGFRRLLFPSQGNQLQPDPACSQHTHTLPSSALAKPLFPRRSLSRGAPAPPEQDHLHPFFLTERRNRMQSPSPAASRTTAASAQQPPPLPSPCRAGDGESSKTLLQQGPAPCTPKPIPPPCQDPATCTRREKAHNPSPAAR